MAKIRPLLAAFLGLMLWVQGFAVAATPVAVADDAQSAMIAPCHDDEAPSAPDCCDGTCIDMAGCTIGHFAGAPAAALQLAAAPRAVVSAPGWSLKTAVPPLPLRPPIVSHA